MLYIVEISSYKVYYRVKKYLKYYYDARGKTIWKYLHNRQVVIGELINIIVVFVIQ